MSDDATPLPDWAEALGREGWDRLDGLLRARLDKKGLPWTDGAEAVVVEHESGTVWRLSKADLARMAAHERPERWAQLVGGFVRVRLAGDPVAELDLTDFSAIRNRVGIRLLTQDQAEGADLVGLDVMPGVFAALAVDLPDRVETLRPETVDAWGLDHREALAFALGMCVRRPDMAHETLTGPAELVLHVLTGPHVFTASCALALEQWCEAQHGAIVAVPNAHTVLWHPVEDARALPAMQAIFELARAPHDQGPASLTHAIYWWLPGKFAQIEVAVEGEDFRVQPPRDFLAILAEMARDDDVVGEA